MPFPAAGYIADNARTGGGMKQALEDFLGPDWQAHQMTPVPAEEPLLAGSPFVDHWDLVTTFSAAQ